MANTSVALPVPPYLPDCSGESVQRFWDTYRTRGGKFNLSNAGDYVYEEVVPSLIPGIVLGLLCLLGFVIFLIWMFVGCCIGCCRCCKGRRGKGKGAAAHEDGTAAEQFIAGAAGQGEDGSCAYPDPSLATARQQKARRPLLSWHNAFWAFFLTLALASVGVAGWGMAESINLTDYTVSDFWALVDRSQSRVEGTIRTLERIQQGAEQLTAATAQLSDKAAEVSQSLQALAGPAGVILSGEKADFVSDVLAKSSEVVGKGSEFIDQGIAFLEEKINATIADIEDTFKPPTMAIQNTWRFLPIAIIFGVFILLVVLTTWAVWCMSWPRTAALLVALLWFMVALLMLLGTGLMNGLYVVSDDACLFAETYVVNTALRQSPNSEFGNKLVNVIQFYMGQDVSVTGEILVPKLADAAGTAAGNAVDKAGDAALQALQVYLPPGANETVTKIYGFLLDISPAIGELSALATNGTLKQFVADATSEAVANSLSDTGVATTLLNNAVSELVELSNRTLVIQIYRDAKVYVCCTLKENVNDLWVAWTVTGSLGIVLVLLASARIMQAAVALRKKHKAAKQEVPIGGAVLWMPPPSAAGVAGGNGGKGAAGGYPAGKGAEYEEPPPQQFMSGAYEGPAPVRDNTGALYTEGQPGGKGSQATTYV